MTQENVTFLRLAYDASNRGDHSVFLDRYHPEIELHVSGTAVEPGVYRGRREVISWWTDVLEAWETVYVSPTEFIDLGDDRVLVIADASARNKQSQVPLEQELAYVWYFAGDQITRLDYYFGGRTEALEAVGLSE